MHSPEWTMKTPSTTWQSFYELVGSLGTPKTEEGQILIHEIFPILFDRKRKWLIPRPTCSNNEQLEHS